MKSLDEAITALKICNGYYNTKTCKDCPYPDTAWDCGLMDLLEDALHYLQYYKQSLDNPPLTWDELKDIAQDDENWKREPVWLEFFGEREQVENRWAIPVYWYNIQYSDEDEGESIECLSSFANPLLFRKDMGKNWNAYRRIPL